MTTANDNANDTEHVTEEDTLLLEWAEFAMANIGATPRAVPLLMRSLKHLADKYPELVKVQTVDADALEAQLCNDPDCEGCNAVRSVLGQMRQAYPVDGKANLH